MKLFFVYSCYSLPPTSLLHSSSYHKMCECFGGKGYIANTPRELINIMRLINEGRVQLPVIVNVLVSPVSEKKQQVCGTNLIIVLM